MIAYEGVKRGGTRGFVHTHFEVDQKSVEDMIAQFDLHFDDCHERYKDESLVETLQQFLDEAEAAE